MITQKIIFTAFIYVATSLNNISEHKVIYITADKAKIKYELKKR